MTTYRRKHLLVEARQHVGDKIVVNSNLKGNQGAVAGDYLVTDPEAPEPRGSVYVVPKADFEKEHEAVDSDAEGEVLSKGEGLLATAAHALRSYENGNSSPELAKEVAEAIEAYLMPPGDGEPEPAPAV